MTPVVRRAGPGYRLLKNAVGGWRAIVPTRGGFALEIWCGCRDDARREAEAELARQHEERGR